MLSIRLLSKRTWKSKRIRKITFKSKNQSNQNLVLKKISSSFNIDLDTGNQNKKKKIKIYQKILKQ